MQNIMDAIRMDEIIFNSTTDAELRAACGWLKQKFGTHNINFMLKNYPGMLTNFVLDMRRN